MFDQVAANKRRSALLIGGFVLLIVGVTAALELLLGFGRLWVVVALLVAGASSVLAYWKSASVALAMSHARPADPVVYARLHNIVEGLCIAGGLPKPGVYVVEDPAPNAFATGRNPQHAAIAVTTGLLEKLDRVELEGVVAHELAHIKNYDILVSTLAVTLVGVVFMFPAPVAAKLMQVAVSRHREQLADMSGVLLTRYPPGLLSALEKLRDDNTAVHSASRATAHLWIEGPVPLEHRIDALREL